PGLLLAAAQRHLRAGGRKKTKERGLSRPSCLQLAGEVGAVAAGLKPAFLYDYSPAGPAQVLRYLRQLQALGGGALGGGGGRLHVLSLADHVLVVNVDVAVRRLEALLLAEDTVVSFVDVSAARTSPALCSAPDVEAIRGHLSEILSHLKALAAGGGGDPSPRALSSSSSSSSSALFSADWNLCTLFGVLLGYPAAYSFPAREEGLGNCLALTPLRVFTVHATCRRISQDLRVRLYSFSVPEDLYSLLKAGIDAWCETLQDASSQRGLN
ncbi:PREDICTED: UPF0739 protein C1orf74 homolog, partial [Gekko japonicus]|uniref:UPF0739 protein C1orf74 homolog n=1 Tax=Gekko japonicus TaxID=146911 RepID=A0ABM1JHD2_GEKJA